MASYETSQNNPVAQEGEKVSRFSLHFEVAAAPDGRTLVELCPGLSTVVGITAGGEGVVASTVAYFRVDS